MISIYKRELRAAFTTLSAPLFIALLLMVIGIYGSALHFKGGLPEFEYLISNIAFVLLIIVPILTMRSFSEERRSRTDQLLYALPLRSTDIVLGKYLALLTVFTIPVAIMCLWPPVLSMYGEVVMATAYTAICGFFLLGAALIAVGLFLSSLTENPLICAVLSFGIMLLAFLMPGIASLLSSAAGTAFTTFTVLIVILMCVLRAFTRSNWLAITVGVILELSLGAVCLLDYTLLEGAAQTFLSAFYVFERLNNFIYGLFDLTGVVYYLSVIFLFTFFSVQNLDKRRWL